MKARIKIMLKNGVLDPQGEAIKHALNNIGFESVTGVRQGKVIELEIDRMKAKFVLSWIKCVTNY
jgi:phosphoribosylformylglycinamidine synthase